VLSDRPKPLAPVGGRPFVVRLVEQVVAAGWGPVVLLTGFLAEAVEAALGTTCGGVELLYSREPEPLGTAGAVRLALPLPGDGPVLLLNGDSWAGVDLTAQLAEHRRSGARATLALVEVGDTSRYGRVRLDGEGWVEAFEEKARSAGGGLINAGIYVLEREVVEGIPAGRAVSMEREVFPALIGRGLKGHVSDGRFIDIGTPESLARAEAFFGEGAG
jgi:NDP-sugar pyrophosphorylase family protein